MPGASLPAYRVTLVVEVEGQVHSVVFVGGTRSKIPAFAQMESLEPVTLLEAHLTLIDEPERPQLTRQRRRKSSSST